MPHLYSFGIVQFTVYPLNIHEMTHMTASDWARKEIAGAPTYREWVGEGDEEIHLRGRVFPHFFSLHAANKSFKPEKIDGLMDSGSGMGHLDLLDSFRRNGMAHLLMRGDGHSMGWYIIERMSRGHTYLGADGIGQQIDFDASFMRVPVPDPTNFYNNTVNMRK